MNRSPLFGLPIKAIGEPVGWLALIEWCVRGVTENCSALDGSAALAELLCTASAFAVLTS